MSGTFWQNVSPGGRPRLFKSPSELWDKCVEYFKWVEANPLKAAELVKFQGKATVKSVPKMRAMTIGGLCLWMDIDQQTWANYRAKKEFFGVVTRAEEVIRTQKMEGAAAELLNPNIIARDLGLADKQEHGGELKISGIKVEFE